MSRRPTRTEIRGRQHSKRKVSIYRLEDGSEAELGEIRAPRVTLRKLPRIMAEMIEVIVVAGVDAAGLLDDVGSLLVERVIHLEEHEPDSLPGLAALIYRDAAHALAYQKMAADGVSGANDMAIEYMAEVGRRITLFDVYSAKSESSRDAGKKGAESRGSQKDEILKEVEKLRANRTDKRSIAGIVAKRVGVTAAHVRRILKKDEEEKRT